MTDTTVQTPETTELVDTYFEMWRATDQHVRAELVRRSFAEGGRHVDPLADAVGHDELAPDGRFARIASFWGDLPGR